MIIPFNGMPLQYLIGSSIVGWHSGYVIEVPYDNDHCFDPGRGIGYCNLFDETGSGNYGPYLPGDDVSDAYGEGRIDPKGPGWMANLTEQFTRRRDAGFRYIELDNPDSYDAPAVWSAIDLARDFDLRVIAKNAAACDAAAKFLEATDACIVERGEYGSDAMHRLRVQAGKPDMVVWFVAFGPGRGWAEAVAANIEKAGYKNMGVTYSARGEYNSSADIIRPTAA